MKRFDTVLWRINGVIILIVSILAIVLASYTSIRIYKMESRHRRVSGMVRLEGVSSQQTKAFLGNFMPVEGSKIYMAPFYKEQNYNMNYYSKTASAQLDWLFYDSTTGMSRRLLGHDGWIVLDHKRLVEDPRSHGRPFTVKAFLFIVVPGDSDGNGRLNDQDRISILYCRRDGSDVRTVAEDVSGLLGIHQPAEDSAVIFVSTEKGVEAITLDISEGRTIKRQRIEEKQ